MNRPYHLRLGQEGEDAAAAHYRAAGYSVLARNWRCDEGEIDLICRKGGTIVFCEVKTRSTSAFGSPAEAVVPAKRRRLRRLGARWLRQHATRCEQVRFDVASVSSRGVHVIPDAF